MTDSQSNKLDMYNVVFNYYTTNQTIIDAVPARQTAFGQLGLNIALINKEIAGQSSNTTGVAQDKTALRNTLDNITNTVLQTSKAWALSINNNTLAAEFDYSLSDIERIKDDTIQGFCNYRIQIVNQNLPALADYGIDATAVTAWQDALTAYVNVLESPRVAINTRHLHTQKLKELFSQTQDLLTQQTDPLMVVFKLSDPTLYNGYKQARIIINRGGQSGPNTPATADIIKLQGNVIDADTNTAIEGATITLLFEDGTPSITTNTNVSGNYELSIKQVPKDTTITTTLEAQAINFQFATQPVTAQAGQTLTFDFELLPVIIP